MPNIGVVLKQEIVRLARKEIRSDLQLTKKASAQHRRHIAALKRQVTALERQVASLRRRTGDKPAAPAAGTTIKVRFVAKGLKSQRERLDLSAADYGRLVGVTAQSIYNWEQGKSTPRAGQVAAIAALRGLGKREAQARLEKLAAPDGKRAR
jgi:DNA-binding XRE family transcriptional regulator